MPRDRGQGGEGGPPPGRADAARSAGSRAGAVDRQVRARYADPAADPSRQQRRSAAGDDQVRTPFLVSSVAIGDTGMQTGYESVGPHRRLRAVRRLRGGGHGPGGRRRAISKLTARPPWGALPVVIGAGGGGVLFHEACGHGLEADLVAKGASVFTGRRGEPVASPLVTLVDDGTMSEEWGCFSGSTTRAPRPSATSSSRTACYRLHVGLPAAPARKAGPSSGNGRRQSYRHLPMVRMTNTYLLGGDGDPADIVASIDHGVRGAARRRTGQHRHRRLRLRHDRGLPHRERPSHLAPAGGEPHRQRAGPPRSMPWATTSPGRSRHLRQGRPGCPVGTGTPTLRVTASRSADGSAAASLGRSAPGEPE